MRHLTFLFILAASLGVIQATADITLRPVINQNDFNYEVKAINFETLNETQNKAVSAEKLSQFFRMILIASSAAIAAAGFLSWAGCFIFILTTSNLISYFWIWIMIGWPSSPLDWNILFLFPVMGIAPAAACIIASAIFFVISLMILKTASRFRVVNFDPQHWGPLLLAAICWAISFVNQSGPGMTEFPESYSWGLFTIGTLFALTGGGLIYFDFFRRKIVFK